MGSNGWYPDPHARWPLRYWDGGSWTDLVATVDASSRLTTGVDIVSRNPPETVAHLGEGTAAGATGATTDGEQTGDEERLVS